MNAKMVKLMQSMKRNIATLLIVFMCIESFGAAVSDNDGATFITKAEFDSLKNTFQVTLNEYNSGIDDKVDMAIGRYLSGITSVQTSVVDLPLKSWERVTMLNYAVENEYCYPAVDLTTTMLAHMRYSAEVPDDITTASNTERYGYENYWASCNVKYVRDDNTKSKRLLCDAGSEGSTLPNNIIWNGLSKNYVDTITLARIVNVNDERWWSGEGIGSGDNTGYLSGLMTNAMVCANATCIYPGYFSSLTTADDNLWFPRWFWNNSDYFPSTGSGNGRRGYRGVNEIYAKSNSLSVVLQSTNSDTVTYEHILNFNNLTYDYFSDPDWVNTLNHATTSGLTRETMLQVSSVSDVWSGLEWWNPGHGLHMDTTDPTKWDLEDLSWELRRQDAQGLLAVVSGDAYGRSWSACADNTSIVSVGLIPKIYDSKHIYQDSDGFSQNIDGKVYKKNKLNLYNGFTLLAANVDDVIEWEPVFIDTYSNNSKMDFELYVSFAIEPFGEGNTVSSNNKFIKVNDQSTAAPVETSSKTIKVKFTMPETGIVYVKWWPKDTTIQSTDWEATLDLKNCATYIRTIGS